MRAVILGGADPTGGSPDARHKMARSSLRRRGQGMENTMRRFTLLLLVALLGGTDRGAAQEAVETRGVTSEIKVDEVVFGHLAELNGKFKLRATELTFAPDGYIGVHHHIGPGIRYVISGELTFAEGGQETVYKAGEYFFETGNLAHTAQNKTNVPLRILVVEILPKDWTAPAMIAPRSQ
jgi:quercetin dioxygenase-like cupin family protein